MTEQVTFQLRRGNSTGTTGWTTVNPVLSQGEPGFEIDTTTLKIGNGSTNWDSLNKLKFGQRVGIGFEAGENLQGDNCIAIGSFAGYTGQAQSSVAIGFEAGLNSQGGLFGSSIAIGNNAGYTGQKESSIAIGKLAGYIGQGANSIAIGNQAGYNTSTSQAANTIILNATGQPLNGGQTGLYVAPIRLDSGGLPLVYNTTSKEITYTNVSQSIGVTGSTGIGVTFSGSTYIVSSLIGVTGSTGIGVTFSGSTYIVSSLIGITGSTGIGVTFSGSTYTVSSLVGITGDLGIDVTFDGTTYTIASIGNSNSSFGITFCGTSFLVDGAPFVGDQGIYIPVNNPTTGYAYVEISVPGVTFNSIVNVSPVVRGSTGVNNSNDWSRVLGVENLNNKIRVWTVGPSTGIYGNVVGSTYAGFAWNVLSFDGSGAM
jgi:hypothetical protein